jgi:hypothetical protein
VSCFRSRIALAAVRHLVAVLLNSTTFRRRDGANFFNRRSALRILRTVTRRSLGAPDGIVSVIEMFDPAEAQVLLAGAAISTLKK